MSRSGAINERDLPSMSASFQALCHLAGTSLFWHQFLDTVRGWALGLGIATALAVPVGIALGSSDFAGAAFRVPIE